MGVEIQGVILNRETAFFGNRILAFFDLGIVKLFHSAAFDAHQMVVMLAVVDFENGLAGFEEVAFEQTGLFKLGQDAIDRGQANVHVLRQQHAIDVFCRHVPLRALLEEFENLEAGKSGFEPHVLEALRVAHRRKFQKVVGGSGADYFGYDIPLQRCLRNPEFRMSPSRLLPTAVFCLVLGACSYKPTFINEYKIDVQQGNVLSQDMVSQLKPGQTREQVRFILGTPLINDIFHQQRWDYVYRYENGKTGQVESRKFSVYFNKEGRLERVGGDVDVATVAELTVPQSAPRLVDLGTLSQEAADKPLPPRTEPGFFSRFMDWMGL